MRNVLVLVAVLFGSLTPAHAQPPAVGDSNPVKLTRVPNTVAPVETTVPDELLSGTARNVRSAFGPGREQLADGFQQSLERAGFDINNGQLTKNADGSVTFTSGAGEEGPVTITATSSGNTLTLRKIWTPSGPGMKPIVFAQPAAAIATKPLVNANGETIVLPEFPPDFPRTPGGASILTPFDPTAPPNPNEPFEPFTPPPGWTPVPGQPNLYMPPQPSPPATQGSTPTVQNTTVGGNHTGDLKVGFGGLQTQVLGILGPGAQRRSTIPNAHLVGNGGVINGLARATYDDSVQYEVITVRIVIRPAVKNGFNLLRDWLLRRPQAIAFGSRFIGNHAAQLPSAPPSRRVASAVSLLLTSTGASMGEAFRVQALSDGEIDLDLTAVAAEPLKGVKPDAITRAATAFAARGAERATAIGYCLEFMRRPPSAGMLYRIAGPEIQKRFEPLRRVAHAARVLADAGQLTSDSDPKSFVHSITQWAIWSSEQTFTQDGFTKAFVDHTRKTIEGAGRPWQREYGQAIEKVAPGRWQQIQRILRFAAM